MDENCLNVREIAGRLGVNKRTVYRLVEARVIPAIRLSTGILRFRWSSVEARLAELERAAVSRSRVDGDAIDGETASAARYRDAGAAFGVPLCRRTAKD